jgi:hypothetical protein
MLLGGLVDCPCSPMRSPAPPSPSCSNGIETKQAIQAGKDAVVQLQHLAATNDAGDIS